MISWPDRQLDPVLKRLPQLRQLVGATFQAPDAVDEAFGVQPGRGQHLNYLTHDGATIPAECGAFSWN